MLIARLFRTVGELMMTAGAVVLLFVVYTLYVTDLMQQGTQDRLRDQFEAQAQAQAETPAAPGQTQAPLVEPALGDGIAVLRIPRLGSDYAQVIVEGVATADLQKGPGHYPGSALPGGDGNFVVSGHRTTYGKPFNRLDEIQTGDAVVVETTTEWFTYRATKEMVVQPTNISVVDALPSDEEAGQKLMTFTTCNPKYSASTRLVLRGVLVGDEKKSDHPSGWAPAALGSGVAPDSVKGEAAIPATKTIPQYNPVTKTGTPEAVVFAGVGGTPSEES